MRRRSRMPLHGPKPREHGSHVAATTDHKEQVVTVATNFIYPGSVRCASYEQSQHKEETTKSETTQSSSGQVMLQSV